ncbi:MAG: TonB-dependent receptor, partial [Calditrichia bacterium]|nr:TonB-dependent receptor [Calditrichia bacterium]
TKLENKIEDLNFKTALNYKFNSANTFKIGAEYNHYYFNNNIQINYLNQQTSSRKPDLKAAFIEDKITMGRLLLRPGVRFSQYSLSDDWYYEPRVNGVLYLPGDYKVKAAYGKYYQYIISINSQEYELSQFLDNYYPIKNKKPSASTHYIFGVEKLLSNNSQLSLDLYYKDLTRIYTFDSHLSTIEAAQFPDKLRQGNGKSYGMEILWKGNYNKFSGWVSYGLSKSTRSYSHIMNGKEFYFDYDRTHSFKAVVNHQIRSGLSYSGTVQIMSGVPKTLERSIKSYYYFDPATNDMATQPVYVADSKNNARMPFIINLDLGLKKRIRKGFAAELADFLGAKESYLNVSLSNLSFLRRNVWIYLPMEEKKYYGFGMNWLPSIGVGYTIKF